jgi:hypothetical protein
LCKADATTAIITVDTTNGYVGIGMTPAVCPLEMPGSTTNSSAKFGSFELQSYAINNCWLSDNLYYNGAWKYRNNGYAVNFYFATGTFSIRTAPLNASGPGAAATLTSRISVAANGYVSIGGVTATCALQIPGSPTEPSFRIGGITAQSAAVGNEWITSNIYYNCGWKYGANGYGSAVRLGDTVGGFAIYTFPLNAGGAGAAATPLTVLSSTNLGAITIPGTLVAGTGTITGAFGCNAAAAQTAYASGGAAATTAGAFGFGSDAERAALTTLVANIRTALVNNGTMS